ncbi:cobalt ABC transporter permease [Psychromonas sp. psych-6C06]|uniref:DUF4140 domain-containing protein n=1 Tax=Psychromonas sp. psych-6C06 TaxID=2058089 RepID=UPI000C340BBB|nr:DUF4140 domain-containing protein [Psychromonas sp. psych-6C06]PKF61591.1 cobalt ABC transporter permease [Psychromonas sp. psych-6C06]
MKIFFASLLMLFMPSTLVAHNVVGGVYASGAVIEGEAGFSNGSMAPEGSVVKIYDKKGTPLGEVLTDAEGGFKFTAQKRITHVFKVNMGAGHGLTLQLPASELPDNLSPTLVTKKSPQVAPTKSVSATPSISKIDIEKAVAKQIKPLRQEIQALKEKAGLRDIIGAIGYIFGLLGLVAFLRERKLKAKQTCHKA